MDRVTKWLFRFYDGFSALLLAEMHYGRKINNKKTQIFQRTRAKENMIQRLRATITRKKRLSLRCWTIATTAPAHCTMLYQLTARAYLCNLWFQIMWTNAIIFYVWFQMHRMIQNALSQASKRASITESHETPWEKDRFTLSFHSFISPFDH